MANVVTKATLGELLKRLYASWEIEETVNTASPLLGFIARRGSANLGGEGFYFPVRLEGAEGIAYIDEDGTLPDGGNTKVKTAVVKPTVLVGVVETTGLSRAISSQDPMAFARAFDEQMNSTMRSIAAYKEGVCFRDGSGLLGTLAEAGDGSKKTLSVSDTSFFREGQRVDILDASSYTAHNTGVRITGLDWVNKTVTFDTAIAATAASGDLIYIAGSQTAGVAPVSREPVGLEGSLLSTGTYLGIDRSTEPNWRAQQYAVNAFFSEDVLMRARTRLTQATGKPLSTISRDFAVVCHPQQVDVLFKLAIPRIQYTGTSGSQKDLGYATEDEIRFGRIPFKTSYACPPDKAYLGEWEYSKALYTPNGELHIDTEHNGSPLKWVSRQDVGLVYLKEYGALAVVNPKCFVRFTSLSTPSR